MSYSCFKHFVFVMLINSVICIAIMAIMLYYVQPLIADIVPAAWLHTVTAVVALILCSPFLWMLLRGGGDNPNIDKLWYSAPRWRVRITAYGALRILITTFFVSCLVDYAIPWTSWLGIFALIAIMVIIFFSSVLEKHSKKMTQKFTDNLNAREKMKK